MATINSCECTNMMDESQVNALIDQKIAVLEQDLDAKKVYIPCEERPSTLVAGKIYIYKQNGTYKIETTNGFYKASTVDGDLSLDYVFPQYINSSTNTAFTTTSYSITNNRKIRCRNYNASAKTRIDSFASKRNLTLLGYFGIDIKDDSGNEYHNNTGTITATYNCGSANANKYAILFDDNGSTSKALQVVQCNSSGVATFTIDEFSDYGVSISDTQLTLTQLNAVIQPKYLKVNNKVVSKVNNDYLSTYNSTDIMSGIITASGYTLTITGSSSETTTSQYSYIKINEYPTSLTEDYTFRQQHHTYAVGGGTYTGVSKVYLWTSDGYGGYFINNEYIGRITSTPIEVQLTADTEIVIWAQGGLTPTPE